jgi:hypothetical protein
MVGPTQIALLGALALALLLLALRWRRGEWFSGWCPDALLGPGSYASPHDFAFANTRERPIRTFDKEKLADPKWAWQSTGSCPYVR